MASSIAWIDLADSDRRQMMGAVSLFKERDTRDELGLGSIRDTFANLFFPGTSTLQTRARYFLFVPWLYRDYEKRKVSSNRVADRLKRDEVKLIRALQDAGETEGVIGRRAGASLQRFPSSIYWNGLREWGILQFGGTQGQYHQSLDYFYRQSSYDDDYAEAAALNWHAGLPEALSEFPSEVDFSLTYEEATYLQERLVLSCSESVLAFIANYCDVVHDATFVWSHPELDTFPPNLQSQIEHARNFSECLHGAVLLYNLMLAELVERGENIRDYRAELQQWLGELRSREAALFTWDQSAFWELVNTHDRIPVPTERFVKEWLALLLDGGNVSDLTDNETARRLVHDREVRLKRGRARLESPRHREMWSGAAGTGQLDYRWPVARQITNDILTGINRD